MVLTRRDTAPAAAATAAAATLAGIALVWGALRTSRGQAWDESAMDTVVAGRDAKLAVLSVLGYVSIGAIVLVVAGCVGVALLRGRARLAVGAVVVIAGANLTTQVLKHVLLDRPDYGLGTLNSLPSGHTTVVASAVGATMLVAPVALRVVVGLVGGFAVTLTGTSTIVAGWHRPSDVVVALAVSLAWTAATAAVLRGPHIPSLPAAVSAVLGSGAALVILVVVGVRPAFGWVGFTQAALVLGAVTAVTAAFVAVTAWVSPAE
ncbi:MAG: hypothetical protein JWP31_2026 [Aeromicrobium sp.]|nr:hypothetical protein [Aeromicrobium sp.]